MWVRRRSRSRSGRWRRPRRTWPRWRRHRRRGRLMAALDHKHRQAQHRLAETLPAGVMGAMLALPEPGSDASRAAYAAFAVRLVGGAQRRSADLAIGYLARLSPPPIGA